MKLRDEHTKIKELLTDTITLLCKNGLQYKASFSVEALIGITLDEEDVFLVNIKESIKNEEKEVGVEVTVERRKTTDGGDHDKRSQSRNSRKRPPDNSPQSYDSSPSKISRRQSGYEQDDASNFSEHSKDSAFNIKSEPQDDDDELVFVKEEGGTDFNNSCAQSGNAPFPIVQVQGGPHLGQNMINTNFPPPFTHPSLQPGATSTDSLPSISTWASTSSQHTLDTSAISGGSQGSNPGRWILSPGSFRCVYCDKRYKAKQNLEAHLRTKHRSGPVLQCACGKRFNWPSMLSKHKAKCQEAVVEGLHDLTIPPLPTGAPPINPRPGLMNFASFDPVEILRSVADVALDLRDRNLASKDLTLPKSITNSQSIDKSLQQKQNPDENSELNDRKCLPGITGNYSLTKEDSGAKPAVDQQIPEILNDLNFKALQSVETEVFHRDNENKSI